jgi:prepilin-type N-terminal cleavage/methylation domain-containing protein
MLGQMNRPRNPSAGAVGGFTLIELLVVIALVAIVVALAAPSLNQMIVMQRLRGTSTQLTTDLQFARSEAVSRQDVVGISFKSTAGGPSCYVVHTCGQPTSADLLAGACTCDCSQEAGSRCSAPRIEIRTVEIPAASGVLVQPTPVFPAPSTPDTVTFDPVTGGITAFYPVSIVVITPPPVAQFWIDTTLIDAAAPAGLRARVSSLGRPSTCAIGAVSGNTPCDP